MGMFEDGLDACMRRTQELMRLHNITYEQARKLVEQENTGEKNGTAN